MGGLSRPDRFADWVAQGHVGRSPSPGELIVVTTDGSYDPRAGVAGWAVVVSPADEADYIYCLGNL